MTEVKSSISDLAQEVSQIFKVVQSLQSADEIESFELPDGIVLPVSSSDELDRLEECFIEDQTLQKHLVSYILHFQVPVQSLSILPDCMKYYLG